MKPSHTVKFWREPELEGLEIGLVRQSAHLFPKHSHEFYAIGLMERGASYCLEYGDDASRVDQGGVALINPGQVHTGGTTDGIPITYRMFYVEPDWMRKAAEDVAERDGGFPEFTSITIRDPRACALLGRLAVAAMDGELLGRQSAMLQALATLLIGHGEIRPAASAVGEEPRAVRIARDRLGADLASKLSLDELARETGLSRYHLLRVFKKTTGLPPHAYRTQLRIERAKALLKNDLPISLVAQETGFSDQSHFTNKFRQFAGCTPGQYLSA